MRKINLSLLILILLFSACTKKSEDNKLKLPVYNIYFLKSSMSSISSIEYQTNTKDKDSLIYELMLQMNTVPRDKDFVKALEDKVKLLSYNIKGNVLYLNFDMNYTNMKATREILARACIVKTFTQIPGIEFVGINSQGQSLSDEKGNPLPIFYASEFIDSIDDINNFEKVELSLYFSTKDGDKLKEEKRKLVHNINDSMEKLIIEELIKGPKSEDLKALLPNNLRVNSISVNDNTCYIDFDDTLLNALNKDNNKLLIYSISNSINSLGNATKVQISINGKNNYKFINDLDLTKSIERNLDYIKEE